MSDSGDNNLDLNSSFIYLWVQIESVVPSEPVILLGKFNMQAFL